MYPYQPGPVYGGSQYNPATGAESRDLRPLSSSDPRYNQRLDMMGGMGGGMRPTNKLPPGYGQEPQISEPFRPPDYYTQQTGGVTPLPYEDSGPTTFSTYPMRIKQPLQQNNELEYTGGSRDFDETTGTYRSEDGRGMPPGGPEYGTFNNPIPMSRGGDDYRPQMQRPMRGGGFGGQQMNPFMGGGGFNPFMGGGGFGGYGQQMNPFMGGGGFGGIDPRAVQANPQGFQNFLQGARTQEQAMPGSTMFSGGGFGGFGQQMNPFMGGGGFNPFMGGGFGGFGQQQNPFMGGGFGQPMGGGFGGFGQQMNPFMGGGGFNPMGGGFGGFGGFGQQMQNPFMGGGGFGQPMRQQSMQQAQPQQQQLPMAPMGYQGGAF